VRVRRRAHCAQRPREREAECDSACWRSPPSSPRWSGGGPNGGRIYELIDPLNTTTVTLDRTTGTFSGGTGAGNFAIRTAIGRLSYEGFAIYPNGVVYFGDEQRP
jgi:hypothetical protein